VSTPQSDVLVLFGATGDLAKRKIFPAVAEMARQEGCDVPVVGFASSEWDDDRLRRHAREALEDRGSVDRELWSELEPRITYVQGDYRDPASYAALRAHLADLGVSHPLFYLAIPPSMFDAVIEGLGHEGLADGARVVVEKPFGRDRRSAAELNEIVHRVFAEDAIFRIDHFLGKESVENLLVFRFANSCSSRSGTATSSPACRSPWPRTSAWPAGPSSTSPPGALRDVVQNHLFQVVALLAMEPPVGNDEPSLRDERAKLFRQIRTFEPADVVRGQYRGYTDEDRRGRRFGHGDLRGPPLRDRLVALVGRAVAHPHRQAPPGHRHRGRDRVQRPTPHALRPKGSRPPHPNHLRFRLGSDDGVTLHLQTKAPGDALASRPVDLEVSFEEVLGARQEAYHRLLEDALAGDARRFGRADSLDEQWRVLEPVLEDPPSVSLYHRGTWGPSEADVLAASVGGWHEPL
jgi:glucose-6-phosphate 1-dehydrogenase